MATLISIKTSEQAEQNSSETITPSSRSITPFIPGLQISQLLGYGGYGQVWKASIRNHENSKDSHSHYALKLFTPYKRSRANKHNDTTYDHHFANLQILAINEISIAEFLTQKAKPDTPIVKSVLQQKTLAFNTEADGNPVHCMLMDFCKGGTLHNLLRRNKNKENEDVTLLKEAEAAIVIRRIAEALRFCHSHDVLHLDVKPGNILFNEMENVPEPSSPKVEDLESSSSSSSAAMPKLSSACLGDFGLARKLVPKSTNQAVYTNPNGSWGRFKTLKYVWGGRGSGTWNYMAPEVKTKGFYSPAADAWSLGAVLLETLTGVVPPLDRLVDMRWHTGGRIQYNDGSWVEHYISLLLRDNKRAYMVWEFELSESVKQCIRGLLTPEPCCRMTISELLSHSWLCPPSPLASISAWFLSNLTIKPWRQNCNQVRES